MKWVYSENEIVFRVNDETNHKNKPDKFDIPDLA